MSCVPSINPVSSKDYGTPDDFRAWGALFARNYSGEITQVEVAEFPILDQENKYVTHAKGVRQVADD